jgi:hypothetical protein
MNTKRTGVILMAAVLLVSAVAPAAVSAQSASLSVDVTQDGETDVAAVTVTSNGTAVENATVEVTAADGYAGAGEYETGVDGAVVLPAPSENVTVNLTATEGGETATTTVELSPPEPVGPFGQVVSAFVDALKGAGFSGPLGQQVSEFATGNDPSNESAGERGPPEGAGPPSDAGPDNRTDDGNETDENGNESRIVPAGPPTESPGNSGSAPGQADDDDGDDDANEEGDDDDANEEGDDDDGSGNGNDGGNGGGNGNGR